MSSTGPSLLDQLKSWPLAVLPHQFLSRIVRHITRWQLPWLKNFLIRRFIHAFNVDMSEAIMSEANDYPDFNAFFTRALRNGARPLPDDPLAIASPVDGRVSACGQIDGERILQAKGHDYSLVNLLGGDTRHAQRFQDGRFATLYLSPRDYHRIHMPCNARLVETVYVPGRLYSVAPHTVRAIEHLFTRNERLVALFETDNGPMAMVMVGAIFVSCMETVWGGVVNPRMGMACISRQYPADGGPAPTLARGEEMGRFNMGSTVILLYGPGQAEWNDSLTAGAAVSMGRQIGTLQQKTPH
ncbi:MAG TPA: archaetidylserine decarboxylase [Gammaproteobacteria bacterium]|jgi:phosphatidylserine decarboxylase|nr:archaetidylserine decarboxylase [Gammaproteobacteria bacterium]